MPLELIGKGGLVTSLLIILAFLVQWLIKSFGGVMDKVMIDCSKREDMLREEITNIREESREERKEFLASLNKYNDSLQDMTNTVRMIQEDIKDLKDTCSL